jgi:hypothetical protein
MVSGCARWIRITVSAALAAVLFTTSSFFGYAQVPFLGELLVSGNNVTVNGEAAANGRTIVVPSSIVTGAGSYATLNFPNVGRIQLSPGSTFSIDGSEAGLRGSLSAGSVTILSAAGPVIITTICGKIVTARSGDVIGADAVCGAGTSPSPTSTAGAAHSNSLLYLLVAAGVLGGVLAGVAGGGGNKSGGSTSPTT